MLAELASFEAKDREMTKSEALGVASTLEDYVVILQKASTRDPASIISQIDSRLIERLHSVLDSIIHVNTDAAQVSPTDDQAFLI